MIYDGPRDDKEDEAGSAPASAETLVGNWLQAEPVQYELYAVCSQVCVEERWSWSHHQILMILIIIIIIIQKIWGWVNQQEIKLLNQKLELGAVTDDRSELHLKFRSTVQTAALKQLKEGEVDLNEVTMLR